MPDLLIELFSEEIPARMQAPAAEALKRLMLEGFAGAGLRHGPAGTLSTPRRLVLMVENVAAESRSRREERKGPATSAPDAAIEGFLRATGLAREQLERRESGKGEVFFAVITHPGRPAAAIVAEVLEHAIRHFPWPKSMRWGAGSLRWVRPLHSILCVLSDETGARVVPLDIDGIRTGNGTRGHRFMAPAPFAVTGPDDYTARLRAACVMLDAAEREEAIRRGAASLAFASGLAVVEDAALLAEIAGLVEWPVPLMGRIDDAFLTLPPEVLQTSMRTHQKYLSLKNPATGRIEGFVTVADIEAPDHGATILRGNRRVLAARLSDARFFWENDLREAKAGMKGWAGGLAAVTFHRKLGSQADRVGRIAALAREIALKTGADPARAGRAAELAKLDLRSAMVGEFPELQGVMGRYYALAAGEPDAVADAVRDHYSPLGPSDEVPTAPVSVAVALADKLDTLTGFWAIDEKPTGSKDPFALRRAALGVIRLVLGNGLSLCLGQVLEIAAHVSVEQRVKRAMDRIAADVVALYSKSEEWSPEQLRTEDSRRYTAVYLRDWFRSTGEKHQDIIDQKVAAIRPVFEKQVDDLRQQLLAQYLAALPDLLSFFHDRLKVHLREEGIRHDVIDACLAMPGNDDLVLLVRRARALMAFLATDDGENLLQGFRRAANILAQAEGQGADIPANPDPALAEAPEERALIAALDRAEAAIGPAMGVEDFGAAMAAMAALRAPVDAFFEAVQVNAPDPALRRNRLALVQRVRGLCSGVADLSQIEG